MATPYYDYGDYDYGGGADPGGGGGGFGNWQADYAAQQEALRRQMEEEMRRQEEERRRQEEEARRAAEEAARRQAEEDARRAAEAQAAQEPPKTFDRTTLGDLMQPPDAQADYDPGRFRAPNLEESFQRPMSMEPPPDMGPQLPPQEEAPPPAPPPGPPSSGPRDFTADPLTGEELAAQGGNPYVQGANAYYGGTAIPTGRPTATRDTSEMDLDLFNQEIRNSELYQQFIHERGLWQPGGKVVEWDERDQDAWKRVLEENGVSVKGGMKVDNAGNINQKNRLVRNVAIAAGIAAGGYFAAPAIAGALGAGGAGTLAATPAAFTGAGFAGAAGAGAAGAGLAAGAGAAAAGGAAAAAGAGAAATGAAAAAGASIVPHVITGLAGLSTAYLGARAQTKAGERAAEAQERGAASSERTITQQMEFEREQRNRDREDAERRWTAEQDAARRMWESEIAHRDRQWDVSEDERLFKRRIFEEDRAAKAAAAAARSGGGGYDFGGGGGAIGPSGPSPSEINKQRAISNLDSLLRQGTPGLPGSYVPATAAGPTGRG